MSRTVMARSSRHRFVIGVNAKSAASDRYQSIVAVEALHGVEQALPLHLDHALVIHVREATDDSLKRFKLRVAQRLRMVLDHGDDRHGNAALDLALTRECESEPVFACVCRSRRCSVEVGDRTVKVSVVRREGGVGEKQR